MQEFSQLMTVHRKLTDRQLKLKKYDEVFEDYASGGSTNRPKLQEMLKWIRKGDSC